MTEAELKQLAVDKVRECKQIAFDKLNFKMLPITVRFRLIGVTAGIATCHWSNKGKITQTEVNLNMHHLTNYTDNFLNETVPHEMAHLLADQYYNARCMHDRRWEHILLDIYGIQPEKYHKMVQGWTLVCNICKYQHAGLDNHKKYAIEQSPSSYICDHCGNFFSQSPKFYLTTAPD